MLVWERLELLSLVLSTMMTQATLAWACVEASRAWGQAGRGSQDQLGVSGAAERDWRSLLWAPALGPAEQMVFFTQREPAARGGTGQLASLHSSVLIVVFCWKIHFRVPLGSDPEQWGAEGVSWPPWAHSGISVKPD